MSLENKEKKKAQNVRRATKEVLTRVLKTGRMMLDAKRSATKIQATVKDAKANTSPIV